MRYLLRFSGTVVWGGLGLEYGKGNQVKHSNIKPQKHMISHSESIKTCHPAPRKTKTCHPALRTTKICHPVFRTTKTCDPTPRNTKICHPVSKTTKTGHPAFRTTQKKRESFLNVINAKKKKKSIKIEIIIALT